MSDSLQPHELQRVTLSCPSPSPRACSNSRPLSQWCHPTISSSVIPFSSCPQSFPASGSFPMSQLFASGGQIIGSFPWVNTKQRERSVMSLDVFWMALRAIQFSETWSTVHTSTSLSPGDPCSFSPSSSITFTMKLHLTSQSYVISSEWEDTSAHGKLGTLL